MSQKSIGSNFSIPNNVRIRSAYIPPSRDPICEIVVVVILLYSLGFHGPNSDYFLMRESRLAFYPLVSPVIKWTGKIVTR